MAIDRQDIAYDSHDDHLKGTVQAGNDEYVLTASLSSVLPGSLVQVVVNGSASGQFYYGPVETTGSAKELYTSWHVFTHDAGWTPLEASALFAVQEGIGFKSVTFRIRLVKGDLSGTYDLYNLSIMARIV